MAKSKPRKPLELTFEQLRLMHVLDMRFGFLTPGRTFALRSPRTKKGPGWSQQIKRFVAGRTQTGAIASVLRSIGNPKFEWGISNAQSVHWVASKKPGENRPILEGLEHTKDCWLAVQFQLSPLDPNGVQWLAQVDAATLLRLAQLTGLELLPLIAGGGQACVMAATVTWVGFSGLDAIRQIIRSFFLKGGMRVLVCSLNGPVRMPFSMPGGRLLLPPGCSTVTEGLERLERWRACWLGDHALGAMARALHAGQPDWIEQGAALGEEAELSTEAGVRDYIFRYPTTVSANRHVQEQYQNYSGALNHTFESEYWTLYPYQKRAPHAQSDSSARPIVLANPMVPPGTSTYSSEKETWTGLSPDTARPAPAGIGVEGDPPSGPQGEAADGGPPQEGPRTMLEGAAQPLWPDSSAFWIPPVGIDWPPEVRAALDRCRSGATKWSPEEHRRFLRWMYRGVPPCLGSAEEALFHEASGNLPYLVWLVWGLPSRLVPMVFERTMLEGLAPDSQQYAERQRLVEMGIKQLETGKLFRPASASAEPCKAKLPPEVEAKLDQLKQSFKTPDESRLLDQVVRLRWMTDAPVFMGARDACALLRCSRGHAAELLKSMVERGILIIAQWHEFYGPAAKANRTTCYDVCAELLPEGAAPADTPERPTCQQWYVEDVSTEPIEFPMAAPPGFEARKEI